MRWFGGYKSLLQLLEIYIITLLVIIILWLCWVVYHALRRQPLIPAASKMVTDEMLCHFYNVNAEELHQCRQASLVTVFFNNQGQIIQLDPSVTLSALNPSCNEPPAVAKTLLAVNDISPVSWQPEIINKPTTLND
jgi:hypothetical protein